MTRAVELAPENADYHNRRGLALSKLERYDDELAATRRAAELDPENAVYHSNAGKALYDLGRYEEALTAYHPGGGAGPGERGLPLQRGEGRCMTWSVTRRR